MWLAHPDGHRQYRERKQSRMQSKKDDAGVKPAPADHKYNARQHKTGNDID